MTKIILVIVVSKKLEDKIRNGALCVIYDQVLKINVQLF